MIHFRKPIEGIDRPQMEADVVIVGGGPAGMACALRLSQLIDEHNATHPEAPLTKENIYVLEKAREVGQHCLSGALLDPRSMRELLARLRKRSADRCRGHQRSRSSFCTQGQGAQIPDRPAAAARPRQLRHLDQQVREVAGAEGRRGRHHHLHRIRRVRSCCMTTTAAMSRRVHRRAHR